MHNRLLRAVLVMLSGALMSLAVPGCILDDDEPSYGVWEACLGQDPSVPALPDYFSNYFAYSFDRGLEGAQFVGLRIVGDFAYARYMSYNIYDGQQGTSYGAVTDFQMLPAAGAVNPFVPGNPWEAENRQYVVTIAPEGYTASPEDNAFIYRNDAVHVLTVILRYYVPQGDAIGGVPMPAIEAFDIRTGEAVDLPPLYSVKTTPVDVYRQRMAPLFRTIVDNTLRFYRNAGGGQFNCADNMYLITAVEMTPDDVLTLRLFPPTFPSSSSEYGQTDVRYWSLNQGNDDTTTPFGIMDRDFRASSDGFVYVAIGDDSIRRRAEGLGYNFMPWLASTAQGNLLYRNMLTYPSYPGAISKVPFMDLSVPANIYQQDARNFIGDYAPTGQKVSKTDFMNGPAGIVPPGN